MILGISKVLTPGKHLKYSMVTKSTIQIQKTLMVMILMMMKTVKMHQEKDQKVIVEYLLLSTEDTTMDRTVPTQGKVHTAIQIITATNLTHEKVPILVVLVIQEKDQNMEPKWNQIQGNVRESKAMILGRKVLEKDQEVFMMTPILMFTGMNLGRAQI